MVNNASVSNRSLITGTPDYRLLGRDKDSSGSAARGGDFAFVKYRKINIVAPKANKPIHNSLGMEAIRPTTIAAPISNELPMFFFATPFPEYYPGL